MSSFQMFCPSYAAAAPVPAAYLPYYHSYEYRSPFSADEYCSWSPKVSFAESSSGYI